jgi:phage regulator Rha-like protein
MNELINKNEMTSLELLEQINLFRKEEYKIKKENRMLTEAEIKRESYVELRHDTLLDIIRDEFEEEIDVQKILETSYKDQWNRKQPMFILTLNQAKQVLLRESKYVRRATIQYIEKLEQFIKELPEKEKILIGFEKTVETIANIYGCKKDFKTIPLKDLVQLKKIIEKNFKEEKPQEILKNLAEDIYYIFKVDNKEAPILPFEEILRLIEKHIEIKPMNLYKVEVKQKLFELE